MAHLAPGAESVEGRRDRTALEPGEGVDGSQGFGTDSRRDPETRSQQPLEGFTSLAGPQLLRRNGPEHHAERAVDLESQTASDQAGRGIISEKPIRPKYR